MVCGEERIEECGRSVLEAGPCSPGLHSLGNPGLLISPIKQNFREWGMTSCKRAGHGIQRGLHTALTTKIPIVPA